MKQITFWAGLAAALCVFTALWLFGHTQQLAAVAAVTVLCAVWWVFEPVPIPVTSLVPLSILPLVGALSPQQVAGSYGHPVILLLIGGFMLSIAMERSGTHLNVATSLLRLFKGTSGRRVVIGFMAASAVLSMWISNAATTLMLLPVALAVVNEAKSEKLTVPLLLAICYGASIGGLGTPIGTPPNIAFMGVYQEVFGIEVTFWQWMKWTIPLVIIFFCAAAWWMTRKLDDVKGISLPPKTSWSTAKIRVVMIFGATALLWITRTEPFGGWREWLNLPSASDANVALLASILLFIVSDGKGEKLMTWEAAKKVPWDILLLFSGGIALAKSFGASGLDELLADQISGLGALPVVFMVAMIALSVTFLTEMTSNTATANLLMPVLASVALASGHEPLLIMLPAVLSASCAFMMPVATAPNAIIFGSGKVPIKAMVRHGIGLNLIGAVIVTGYILVRLG